jgi:Ni,Fe-hydrogenase I large subunit
LKMDIITTVLHHCLQKLQRKFCTQLSKPKKPKKKEERKLYKQQSFLECQIDNSNPYFGAKIKRISHSKTHIWIRQNHNRNKSLKKNIEKLVNSRKQKATVKASSWTLGLLCCNLFFKAFTTSLACLIYIYIYIYI